MPVYEWKRWVPCKDAECVEGCPVGPGHWEYELTDSHTTRPRGRGWRRVYSLGIMSVSGAGGSPARKVNTRGSD